MEERIQLKALVFRYRPILFFFTPREYHMRCHYKTYFLKQPWRNVLLCLRMGFYYDIL